MLDDLRWDVLFERKFGAIFVARRVVAVRHDIVKKALSEEPSFRITANKLPPGENWSKDVEVLANSEWGIQLGALVSRHMITWVDTKWEEAKILVRTAGALQEVIFEEVSDPIPPCPIIGHDHPLSPKEVASEAFWVCPLKDSFWKVRIGTIRPNSPSS